MAKNEVYVSRNLNSAEFFVGQIRLADVHWINDPLQSGDACQIRVRHRAKLVDAVVDVDGDYIVIKPSVSERAIAPGQSIVLYKGEECLGGGIVI